MAGGGGGGRSCCPAGSSRDVSCAALAVASRVLPVPPPPPPRALLLFQMPCHNSARMCFSQLSSAPAGKTKFSKHRKHPAENILIKQTPHKISFWRGKKAAPPVCQCDAGRRGKTSRQAGAGSSRASVADGSVSGTQVGAWPSNLAWIFLNRGLFLSTGTGKAHRKRRGLRRQKEIRAL